MQYAPAWADRFLLLRHHVGEKKGGPGDLPEQEKAMWAGKREAPGAVFKPRFPFRAEAGGFLTERVFSDLILLRKARSGQKARGK